MSLFCNEVGNKQVKTKMRMNSNKRFEANDSNITVQVAKITHIYAKSWQLKYNKVFKVTKSSATLIKQES